jgi:hypothetical protein
VFGEVPQQCPPTLLSLSNSLNTAPAGLQLQTDPTQHRDTEACIMRAEAGAAGTKASGLGVAATRATLLPALTCWAVALKTCMRHSCARNQP